MTHSLSQQLQQICLYQKIHPPRKRFSLLSCATRLNRRWLLWSLLLLNDCTIFPSASYTLSFHIWSTCKRPFICLITHKTCEKILETLFLLQKLTLLPCTDPPILGAHAPLPFSDFTENSLSISSKISCLWYLNIFLTVPAISTAVAGNIPWSIIRERTHQPWSSSLSTTLFENFLSLFSFVIPWNSSTSNCASFPVWLYLDAFVLHISLKNPYWLPASSSHLITTYWTLYSIWWDHAELQTWWHLLALFSETRLKRTLLHKFLLLQLLLRSP